MKKKFDQLVHQASRTIGDSKLALFEEAIHIADQYLDRKERYSVRMEYIGPALDTGNGEKAISAFNWCLNEFDQHPEQYKAAYLLWHYKAIVNEMMAFPHFDRQTIEEAMRDLRRRLLSYGFNQRYYYKIKMKYADHLGNMESMETYYHKWLAEPEDRLSDCQTCELHQQACTLIKLKRDEEAYQVAKPILEGKYYCGYTSRTTHSYFLLPLLHHNRKKEAAKLYRKGAIWINENAPYLTPYLFAAAKHIEYLAIVHRKQAISLIEKYLPVAIACSNPLKRYYFYRAIMLFYPYRKQFDIQMPKGVTISSIEKELYELAEAFDHRNGTRAFVERIQEGQREIAQLKKQYSHS